MSFDLKKMAPDHIGILSNDIDESKKLVEAVFGELEWRDHEVVFPPECILVGSWFKIRSAAAKVGVYAIELLQPLDGEDSYLMQTFKEKGPGLHHFGYKFVSNEERMECIEQMVKEGYKIVQATERTPEHKTHYLVAPDNSMIYDIKT